MASASAQLVRGNLGWSLALVLAGACAAGLAAVYGGWVAAVGLALALPIGLGILFEPRIGVVAAIGLATLLPYGVLPAKVVITPSFLTLAMLATGAVWLVRLLLDRHTALAQTAIDLPGLVLLSACLFSFVTGIDRGYTTQTFHDFAKLMVVLVFTLVIVNTVRAGAAPWIVASLVGGAAGAAALGLLLYAGGRSLTESVLVRLIPLGYPSDRVVRWIEDDPYKPMRLTSTGVDPNSFGGLMMLTLVLAVGQFVARQPRLPRWFSGLAIPPIALALLLTYSRAAWLGAAVGVVFLATVAYRWLWPLLGLGALGMATAGIGAGFIGRLVDGFMLQDPATRLRLSEYTNAMRIIQEYPVFGVGFGRAPSIDLQTGVSSIYLLIASRMGLVGLAAFLWTTGAAVLALWRGFRRQPATADGELVLTLLAAIVACLATGVLDHYFFNIEFSHMALAFWVLIGTGLGMLLPAGPAAQSGAVSAE